VLQRLLVLVRVEPAGPLSFGPDRCRAGPDDRDLDDRARPEGYADVY
jgi:hypothetical protein